MLWTQAVQRDGWWWLRKLVLLPCQLLGVFSVSVGDLHGSKCCVCPLHASRSLFCNLGQGENCNKGQVFILLFKWYEIGQQSSKARRNVCSVFWDEPVAFMRKELTPKGMLCRWYSWLYHCFSPSLLYSECSR